MSIAAPMIACLAGEPVRAPPRITSIGLPPDRHAQRIVKEILDYLLVEQQRLRAPAVGLIDVNRMGTPIGQERVAARLKTALGPLALSVHLATGRRGKFKLLLSEWAVWDPETDAEADPSRPAPSNAGLAVVTALYTGSGHQGRVKSHAPLVMSRHSLQRLATRAGARTADDLIVALSAVWGVTADLIARLREDWLKPPNGHAWILPLTDGLVAVLAPDRSGEPRLVLKTILTASMTAALDPVRNESAR